MLLSNVPDRANKLIKKKEKQQQRRIEQKIPFYKLLCEIDCCLSQEIS